MNANDKTDFLIELGNRIKELRELKGYTQSEFANFIGKDQPSINRLEKGRINPSYIYLLQVAKGLDLDLKDIV